MPIVRSPWTLECPRTGHSPADGLPMLPCSRATLTNSLIVATELRCWVIPIAQQTTVADESRSIAAAFSIRARSRPVARSTSAQSRSGQVVGVLDEAVGVLLDEVAVDRTPLQQQRPERLEQREVAVDPHGEMEVGQPDAGDQPEWRLRILEPHQAGLAQRVDRDDLCAVPLRLLERRQHAGVVGAGVLADDQQQLGGLDVAERHRPLTDPDRLGERHRGRLVAHVGAVGKVVGAERAGEQLVGERRLVGGLARRVEDGLVRTVEPLEVAGGQGERLVPADRLVVGGAVAQHHRLRDPALLAPASSRSSQRAPPGSAWRRSGGRGGAASPPR